MFCLQSFYPSLHHSSSLLTHFQSSLLKLTYAFHKSFLVIIGLPSRTVGLFLGFLSLSIFCYYFNWFRVRRSDRLSCLLLSLFVSVRIYAFRITSSPIHRHFVVEPVKRGK